MTGMTGKVDGRRQRSQRTREAILDALLDLVSAGNLEPTGAEIAARAGVALRSLGQHFESREALYLAAALRHGERSPRVVERALPSTGTRAERLVAFVARRARELEHGAALRRAVALVDYKFEPIARAAGAVARARRAEVAAAFAPELTGLSRAARAELLDRLDLLAQGRVWDGLRRDLGLSYAVAEQQLGTLLASQLAALSQPR